MTPEEFTQDFNDALALVMAIAAEHPELALGPAVDLLSNLATHLPPLEAKALDPGDRAAADAEAAVALDAKFPGAKP